MCLCSIGGTSVHALFLQIAPAIFLKYRFECRGKKHFKCVTMRKSGRDVIKQLLDEVEHDIVNYQNRGLCYLPKPKAEADNTGTRF